MEGKRIIEGVTYITETGKKIAKNKPRCPDTFLQGDLPFPHTLRQSLKLPGLLNTPTVNEGKMVC